jgi:hypothetical protein
MTKPRCGNPDVTEFVIPEMTSRNGRRVKRDTPNASTQRALRINTYGRVCVLGELFRSWPFALVEQKKKQQQQNNNQKKNIHNTKTKYDRLAQTFLEQKGLIVIFIFTNYPKQYLR